MPAKNDLPQRHQALNATGAAVNFLQRNVLVMDSTFFSNAAENGRMCAMYQIFEYMKTFRACAFAFASRSNLLYCHFPILSTRSEIRDCSIASWAMSHDLNYMPRCLNGRFGSMEVIPSGGGNQHLILFMV
ncbi:hypothetical protein DSO57_1028781 [Entomophthora muscae]|uniref:Uncharacterized protein n=1 Tax=Entomophthora muscae TaxID=34485 RepID=A0ACC2TCK4_9FUNG|nr:hypothetical protein DSO57_1028781 [Entomophthora muscae]